MITGLRFPGPADENHLALSTLHPHGPHFRASIHSVALQLKELCVVVTSLCR